MTKIEIHYKDITTFLKSYMMHVDQGGLFIKTDNPLPLETPVLLKITLPNMEEPIEAQGAVVLTCPKAEKGYFSRGMGIRFVTISPEDSEKILSILEGDKEKSKNLSFL
jgi:uncharacterized protein (TIGR02266 family)